MALTKPRAYQLYDIDYKQAARVVTTTNVVLSGGAPKIVDSVVLTTNDRVLVTGQTNSTQNGLYYVANVGVGSSGTWSRAQDAAVTGQLLSGTLVAVTEGIVYKDTQWILTTDGIIRIGITPLVFKIFKGESFGTINANGTVIQATESGELLNLIAANNIGITGDPTTQTITISSTYAIQNVIENGNSIVNIPNVNGSIQFTVNSANIASITPTGFIPTVDNFYSLGNSTNQWQDLWVSGNTVYIGNQSLGINIDDQLSYNGATVLTLDSFGLINAGNIGVLGNITTGNIIGDGGYLGNINGSNVIGGYGNSNVVAILTTYTGNITANNITVSNVVTVNSITSNTVTAGLFSGNGALLTNINYSNVVGSYGDSNVTILLESYSGNITANNINATDIFATQYTGNGSLLTGLYANANVANYLPIYSGNVSANYYTGNGSLLSGLYANSNVANYLPTYVGNISANNVSVGNNITASKVTNTAVITRTLSIVTSGSITPPADTVDQYNVTALATGALINAPSGTPTDGQKLTLRIKDNGISHGLVWNAIYSPIGFALPSGTTPFVTMYVYCVYNSSDVKWDVTSVIV